MVKILKGIVLGVAILFISVMVLGIIALLVFCFYNFFRGLGQHAGL